MKSAAIERALGEMYGDRAVQAPFVVIASKRDAVAGIERTMIGGVILAGMCSTEGWERWRGTAILIPQRVDIPRSKNGSMRRLEQMMLTYLADGEDDEFDPSSSFWKQSWAAGGTKNRSRSG